MTISVLTNVASLNAQRNLTNTQSALAASVGRLSSGMRINTASDDAAGLGISENLKANIRSITQLTTSTLGSTSLHLSAVSLSTAANAQAAIGAFDKAIQQLSQARAKVGATQNRMTVTVSNLAVAQENLTAANSRIRDVDVA